MYTLNTHRWAQISLHFSLRPATFEIQGCWKLEMLRMIPEWPKPLKYQNYPVYTEYSQPRRKFHSVSLYNQPFSRYKFVENQKCTEWHQNHLNHLTVKSTVYTLNTLYRGPNFTLFLSTISRFRDTIKLVENRKYTERPRMTSST